MAKVKTVFVCQQCGGTSPKWQGKCTSCGEWNSYVEESQEKAKPAGGIRGEQPVPLPSIEATAGVRATTTIQEYDRVLGGGVVPGSVILIGGDPGIGKSTLLLQAMHGLASVGAALYVTGEESPQQVRLRAERLKTMSPQVSVLAETNLDNVLSVLKETSPKFICIDSIQTVYSEGLASAAGSVGQIREVAARLVDYAKKTDAALFLIGHVTKEGTLAGPRVLEHMVDTVLYFEGDRGQPFRILRAIKNRFGSTNEIGVFEMKEAGLRPVENPSEIFLAERPMGASGSVVLPTLEGTRPILVEVQALVSPAIYGNARRTAMGVDLNRINLRAAVLEKKGGLQLVGQDIFVNVAGGVRIDEPAADLALAMAIASSFQDKPLKNDTIVVGELGLTGEVRGVAQLDQRLHEAYKLGFRTAVVPEINVRRLEKASPMELIPVTSILEALDRFPRVHREKPRPKGKVPLGAGEFED
jgi:DNA repair protein RadA/Sms